jgi:hypothetical protein
MSTVMADDEPSGSRTSRISRDGFGSVGRVPRMTCQGIDSPQIPHRDAELLLYLHLRRAGPMEAITLGVPPGQLSRSFGKSSWKKEVQLQKSPFQSAIIPSSKRLGAV